MSKKNHVNPAEEEAPQGATAAAGSSCSNVQNPCHFRFRINWYQPVATWHWKTEEEVCSICHGAFDACCPACLFPGDECPPVWGECSHGFHVHCIVQWLQKSGGETKLCPMCRREFKFSTREEQRQRGGGRAAAET